MTPTVDNVLAVWNRCTLDAFRDGIVWYPNANAFARSLDPIRFHRAAGIIAALSPMNGWKNNKAKAALLYRQNGEVVWNGTKNGIGLATNVRKAIDIYNGEDALDILTSNKVNAFYLSIVDPYGDHSPVIDRHAFDIAVGQVTDDAARRQLERKGEYARFSDVYRDAASIIGFSPAQVQAVTWEQWRDERGVDWY